MAQLTPQVWRQSVQGAEEINKARLLLWRSGVDSVQINENRFVEGRLPDIYPGHGLLSAIHTAAFFDVNRDVLLVAADMPLLTADMLRWLIATGRNHQCSCHYRTSPLPLYFHNDDFSRNYLEQRLTRGSVSQDDLSGLNCIELVAPYASHLTRLNLSPSAE